MDGYCLTEAEWLPLDIHVMVAGLGSLGLGWFNTRVTCLRYLMEDGAPVGHLFLFHDEVRRHYKGETFIVEKLHSEDERVAALEAEFGVVLTREEQNEIVGTAAELKDEGDFYG